MRRVIFNKQEENDIMDSYLEHHRMSLLSRKYKVSIPTINNVLTKNGIKVRGLKSKNEIMNIYNEETKNIDEIVNKTNLSKKTIFNILRQNGVYNRRKHNLNDNAFSGELTEEKAYWIGFLMADGCISKNLDRITINIQLRDKEHIEKFNRFLNSNYSVKEYKGKDGFTKARIDITSKQIKADLIKYGVIPRKTSVAIALNEIENNRHFWRGMIDGDGSIIKRESDIRKPQAQLEMCGSCHIVEQFRKYSDNFISVKNKNTKIFHNHEKSDGYTVFYYCKNAFNLINHFYENSNIFLERKFIIYKDLINLYKNN